MKKILALTLLFSVSLCYCQTDAEIDALTVEMCKTLEENKAAPDSVSVKFAFEKHLPYFLEKNNIDTEEKYSVLFDKIYVRFQKNCNLFVDIVKRNINDKSDTEILQSAPAFNISKKDCKKLTQQKKFYYLEPDGSKVHVTIDNGKWSEKFEDGSFSLLDFKWTGDCEFELSFIESNNSVRKNLSAKGDKYKYGIFDQKDKNLKFFVRTNTDVVQSAWLYAE